MKSTRSKRVSDTVHFKHKYITQPTLTPEDTLVKAINDLTQALKESRNMKGTLQIEVLLKMDELFNKKLTSPTEMAEPPEVIQPSPRVAFAESSKPPQDTPTPRAAIEKMPNPRVAIEKATIDKAMSKEAPKSNHPISIATNNRARIQNRHQMSLRRQDQNKRAQLIHDKETRQYLNYQQLLGDPKHRETWERSAANEFGRLAQGLKDG